MRIIAVSDVHEHYDALEPLPAGDVLVIAGDLCERPDASFAAADAWLASVAPRFESVIYVPGNHDAGIVRVPRKYRQLARNLLAAMLVDATVEIHGLRFHAMPWDFGDREAPEAAIPEGLDVLVTHEPPAGVRDWSPRSTDDRLGNRELRRRVEIAAPRLHVFGHCHAAYGAERRGPTFFVNVAICGDPKAYYRAAHPATIIDIDRESIAVTQPH